MRYNKKMDDSATTSVLFTEFDVVVLVILMVTAVTSYMRGFIKDVLVLSGFVVAGLSTVAFYPATASFMGQLFRDSLVTSGVAVVVLFLLSLMVVTVITTMMLDNLREMRMGAFDRIAGILFGLFKGWMIVSAVHYTLFITLFFFSEEEPEWLKMGETYGLTKAGSDVIDGWWGEDIRARHAAFQEEMERRFLERQIEKFQSSEDIPAE